MNSLEFTQLVWVGSMSAGFFGSRTGLGGGVVIVPLLTLLFGVDIRYAIGASLVSVTATSSGAASAYVKEAYSNLRIGMFLEIATTAGRSAGRFWRRIFLPRRSRSFSDACCSTRHTRPTGSGTTVPRSCAPAR